MWPWSPSSDWPMLALYHLQVAQFHAVHLFFVSSSCIFFVAQFAQWVLYICFAAVRSEFPMSGLNKSTGISFQFCSVHHGGTLLFCLHVMNYEEPAKSEDEIIHLWKSWELLIYKHTTNLVWKHSKAMRSSSIWLGAALPELASLQSSHRKNIKWKLWFVSLTDAPAARRLLTELAVAVLSSHWGTVVFAALIGSEEHVCRV